MKKDNDMEIIDNREDIILTPEENPEEDTIEQIITLYDEDGNPEEYELIDLFEYNGGIYGAFTPVLFLNESTEAGVMLVKNTETNKGEQDVVMLKITADGNAFTEIDNPAEEEAAFQELLRREAEDLD